MKKYAISEDHIFQSSFHRKEQFLPLKVSLKENPKGATVKLALSSQKLGVPKKLSLLSRKQSNLNEFKFSETVPDNQLQISLGLPLQNSPSVTSNIFSPFLPIKTKRAISYKYF